MADQRNFSCQLYIAGRGNIAYSRGGGEANLVFQPMAAEQFAGPIFQKLLALFELIPSPVA